MCLASSPVWVRIIVLYIKLNIWIFDRLTLRRDSDVIPTINVSPDAAIESPNQDQASTSAMSERERRRLIRDMTRPEQVFYQSTRRLSVTLIVACCPYCYTLPLFLHHFCWGYFFSIKISDYDYTLLYYCMLLYNIMYCYILVYLIIYDCIVGISLLFEAVWFAKFCHICPCVRCSQTAPAVYSFKWIY